MRGLLLSAFALLMLASGARAQTTLTATCKNGTAWSGTGRITACLGHQGVKAFGSPSPTATIAAPGAASPVPCRAISPVVPLASSSVPAPGGGADQVWVNTSTKVYHCPGDRYYGKTKRGSYMTEAAAKAGDDRPDHGKACS